MAIKKPVMKKPYIINPVTRKATVVSADVRKKYADEYDAAKKKWYEDMDKCKKENLVFMKQAECAALIIRFLDGCFRIGVIACDPFFKDFLCSVVSFGRPSLSLIGKPKSI